MIDKYNYAFLDEGSKREIRRSVLKAVAIPGYQVPFGSRELPIGRGWGTGGMVTKLQAGKIATENGIEMVIASGEDMGAAYGILEGTRDIGTTFLAKR